MNKQETMKKIEKIISEYKDDLKPGELKPETTFADLDFDSLDVVDMVMACEDEFGIEIPDDANLKSVQDLLDLIEKAEGK
ncbi:MAG TPA: acyl carrier protein [Ruminococcaceae bacterium]|jgi:acyl carrier protein|nr:acyl carrier protein [Oscillospiraceae bacterium]HCA71343.1 acyl carrier protein [Oscillospiraceae bacterium]HCC01118.1 acyl carrier protein [Oscillospiraceae bacterium]HCM22727.1 acyl carrier protein [Oscillospiraceae bacterium]